MHNTNATTPDISALCNVPVILLTYQTGRLHERRYPCQIRYAATRLSAQLCYGPLAAELMQMVQSSWTAGLLCTLF
jgi:hypothetical protein